MKSLGFHCIREFVKLLNILLQVFLFLEALVVLVEDSNTFLQK